MPAFDWAQIHETSGLHIGDYIALCRRCHLRYDGRPDNGKWKKSAETRARMSVAARMRVRDGAGKFTRRAGVILSLAALALTFVFTAHPVSASASTEPIGGRVLDWAEAHATGHWYGWGGTGLSVYDCSGLVYRSARQLGYSIPRTTGGMLAGSTHLYRIPLSQARRGDLLFWGSGHVELKTVWYHTSFGAHHSGTRVGWRGWNSYYAPTMAMRFR